MKWRRSKEIREFIKNSPESPYKDSALAPNVQDTLYQFLFGTLQSVNRRAADKSLLQETAIWAATVMFKEYMDITIEEAADLLAKRALQILRRMDTEDGCFHEDVLDAHGGPGEHIFFFARTNCSHKELLEKAIMAAPQKCMIVTKIDSVMITMEMRVNTARVKDIEKDQSFVDNLKAIVRKKSPQKIAAGNSNELRVPSEKEQKAIYSFLYGAMLYCAGISPVALEEKYQIVADTMEYIFDCLSDYEDINGYTTLYVPFKQMKNFE